MSDNLVEIRNLNYSIGARTIYRDLELTIQRGQVTALTKKPREFMRVTGASLGCPTFSLDGRLVGIAVNRSLRSRRSLTVLIPAADVLEIAEQAKNADASAR